MVARMSVKEARHPLVLPRCAPGSNRLILAGGINTFLTDLQAVLITRNMERAARLGACTVTSKQSYERFDIHRNHRRVFCRERPVRPLLRKALGGLNGNDRSRRRRLVALCLLVRGNDSAGEILIISRNAYAIFRLASIGPV